MSKPDLDYFDTPRRNFRALASRPKPRSNNLAGSVAGGNLRCHVEGQNRDHQFPGTSAPNETRAEPSSCRSQTESLARARFKLQRPGRPPEKCEQRESTVARFGGGESTPADVLELANSSSPPCRTQRLGRERADALPCRILQRAGRFEDDAPRRQLRDFVQRGCVADA